jgi:hypothetical protein
LTSCSTPCSVGWPFHRFITASHYNYLVLKILAANGVVTMHTNRKAMSMMVEKLYRLVVALATEEVGEQDMPPLLRACGPSSQCPILRGLTRQGEAAPFRPPQQSTAIRSPPCQKGPCWSEFIQTLCASGQRQNSAHKDHPGQCVSLRDHLHRFLAGERACSSSFALTTHGSTCQGRQDAFRPVAGLL